MEKPVSVQPLRARVAALLELTPPEADTLERVHAWIEAECHRPLTIKEIAHVANMSPAHLYRAFVKRFGLTPSAYLRQCRMDRAATLLYERQDVIKELVEEVGYRYATNFATAFKRVHGATPTAFRSQDCPPSPKNTELDRDD